MTPAGPDVGGGHPEGVPAPPAPTSPPGTPGRSGPGRAVGLRGAAGRRGPTGRGVDDLRRHNLSAVLQAVHHAGAVSRAQLTTTLALSRSTVGDLVGDMVEAGLLVERRPDASSGRGVGRPSLLVRPAPGSPTVLAVYADVHRVRVALVGLGGEVLGRLDDDLPAVVGPARAASAAASLAARLVPTAADRARLVGVGAAVPGTVRAGTGVVGLAPHLGWVEAPFGDALADALAAALGRRLPVELGNDADLGVVAEHLRGGARSTTDVVYLCGTWGLGSGIISGGNRLTGRHGFAGEVGHIGVDPEGRACHCGSRGCWESESQASAWAAPLDLDADAPDVAARVLERLDRGGVAARRTRDRVSRSFARGLASIVNVFDPQAVLLGAGLWQDLWPAVEDDVMPWVDRLVLPALRGHVDVRPAGLGTGSTLVGAAEVALAPLLADPLLPAAPLAVAP